MQYPEKSFEHRDAVLGISFPLGAIDYYPAVCGKTLARTSETPAPVKKAPRDIAGRQAQRRREPGYQGRM